MAARDTSTFATNKRKFIDFLEHNFDHVTYRDRIKSMLERDERRLIINIDDLRNLDSELARGFVLNPNEYFPAFQEALKDVASRTKNIPDKEGIDIEYFIGVEGSFGANHMTPRGLSSSYIRSLVCVDGIVTKCSLVRPKVVRSVHYCEDTDEIHTKNYVDTTTPFGAPTTTAYPTKDPSGKPLVTEFGLCLYKDSQSVSIQEMPERAPAGQLPRSVDLIFENDLVDRVKPGDRVQVVGVYRALPNMRGQTASGIFRTVLHVNYIKQLSREASGPPLTEVDIKNIRDLADREDAFELLSSSLAPSIYGHTYIKKSILLLLLGGVENNLANGTHLRGDINMLLVGDPSTAKSQLLRFVLHIAPLAISTSGRGSSGVGLTAAVTTDPETSERRLEAGAMVLADRGVVCIDEFDKMSQDDRVAIHEVMEQQTVTIAKAGIHTTLNARCSVVAAANPVYGKYNRQKKPTENIALPDSLLSRFDLLFIVLDNLNPENDREISDHVLRMHRYRKAGEYEGEAPARAVISGEEGDADEVEDDGSGNTAVYQKFNRILHGGSKRRDIISIPFVQKYLLYAKNRFKPRLTEAARESITAAYTELRSKEDMKTLPITPRTLETMIRLSEAHAKCRLSNEVSTVDTEVALKLMKYALYHEATVSKDAAPKQQSQNINEGNGVHHNDSDVDGRVDGASADLAERDDSHLHRRSKRPRSDAPRDTQLKTPSSQPTSDMYQSQDQSLSQSQSQSQSQSRSQSHTSGSVSLDNDRVEEFTAGLSSLFRKNRSSGKVAIVDVQNEFGKSFSPSEVDTLLLKLVQENSINMVDGFVYRMG